MNEREVERNRKVAEALLAGGRVVEVAEAFGISRQRVYVIAEAEGLERRWVRREPETE